MWWLRKRLRSWRGPGRCFVALRVFVVGGGGSGWSGGVGERRSGSGEGGGGESRGVEGVVVDVRKPRDFLREEKPRREVTVEWSVFWDCMREGRLGEGWGWGVFGARSEDEREGEGAWGGCEGRGSGRTVERGVTCSWRLGSVSAAPDALGGSADAGGGWSGPGWAGSTWAGCWTGGGRAAAGEGMVEVKQASQPAPPLTTTSIPPVRQPSPFGRLPRPSPHHVFPATSVDSSSAVPPSSRAATIQSAPRTTTLVFSSLSVALCFFFPVLHSMACVILLPSAVPCTAPTVSASATPSHPTAYAPSHDTSLCALPPPSPRHTPSQPLPPASLHPTLTHPSLPTLPIHFPSPHSSSLSNHLPRSSSLHDT